MNKVSGTLYKSTLLSTRMRTHTRKLEKSMGEYKLIQIKKTPIKNGMYFIEKNQLENIPKTRTPQLMLFLKTSSIASVWLILTA